MPALEMHERVGDVQRAAVRDSFQSQPVVYAWRDAHGGPLLLQDLGQLLLQHHLAGQRGLQELAVQSNLVRRDHIVRQAVGGEDLNATQHRRRQEGQGNCGGT